MVDLIFCGENIPDCKDFRDGMAVLTIQYDQSSPDAPPDRTLMVWKAR